MRARAVLYVGLLAVGYALWGLEGFLLALLAVIAALLPGRRTRRLAVRATF